MPKTEGCEPPTTKKQKIYLNTEAERAQKFLLPCQPDRVALGKIGWHPRNRGGQCVMPQHTHTVALNIVEKMTSSRRYGVIYLVEVPKAVRADWLQANREKARRNSLLPPVPDELMYANLRCTHFTQAHKLIQEGHRFYMDNPKSTPLKLHDEDTEGQMIQEKGVKARVYSEDLWYDEAALLALLREDNANAEVTKAESELDSFGTTHQIVTNMTDGVKERTLITDVAVMDKIRELGLGSLDSSQWKDLIRFRLFLKTSTADLMLDTLFFMVNGRVSADTKSYTIIGGLSEKHNDLSKAFLLIELYISQLLDIEEQQKKSPKAVSQRKNEILKARKIDKATIVELAKEKELLLEVESFFKHTFSHYSRPCACTALKRGAVAYVVTAYRIGETLKKCNGKPLRTLYILPSKRSFLQQQKKSHT